jgi:hypothetical protein
VAISSQTAELLGKRLAYAIYATSLGISISVWFLAIHAPLRMDETGSYWQISAGLSHIWSRQSFALALPAYYYILWFSTKLLGTSEIALRIPSIIAMLAAAYLFYLIGRELFGREIAILGLIIFCLNPIVVFEAVDVRAYAFAVLVTNATLLLLLRLRSSDSNWLAAAFGFAAAIILYFQILFSVILPALFIWFFYFEIRRGSNKIWQQSAAAFAAFAISLIPLVSVVAFLFRTAKSHVFSSSAPLMDFVVTLAPGGLIALGIAELILAALALSPTDRKTLYPRWTLLFCCSIALIPTFILFGADALTPIHVFVPRYCLVAVPGIALCWAMLFGSFRSRVVRLGLCILFVALWILYYSADPTTKDHGGSWKYALQDAQKNASSDNAAVLICSNFPESDYGAMPLDAPSDSFFFAPLSYYRLSVPIVPLPRSLNAEAIRVGSRFLKRAESRHARFLAIAAPPSYATLRWLVAKAAGTYNVHTLAIYYPIRIKVLEFKHR